MKSIYPSRGRSQLLWKLFSVNLPVIAIIIGAVWVAIDYLSADYFMTLMKQYNLSPTTAHEMFINAVHRYLLWASLLAIACAMACSFFLTRKVLRPLSDITTLSQQLANGEYHHRARIASRDEVGQLSEAFNYMAESLQRTEQLRSTMVSDVAHELRTPLTNMQGYLEALRDGVIEPKAETFELLHSETLRLVKLTEGLLQLTKADATVGTLQPRPVKFQELVDQAIDLCQLQFVAKHLNLTLSIDSDMRCINADPDALSQALRNLLHNAHQYTPPSGSISITAKRQAQRVQLTVTNTGEGIPPHDLPFIFERFYRGEKSRSRIHGGAGIGLAVVKGIIEAHGGQVGATSSAGLTHIWLSLPA